MVTPRRPRSRARGAVGDETGSRPSRRLRSWAPLSRRLSSSADTSRCALDRIRWAPVLEVTGPATNVWAVPFRNGATVTFGFSIRRSLGITITHVQGVAGYWPDTGRLRPIRVLVSAANPQSFGNTWDPAHFFLFRPFAMASDVPLEVSIRVLGVANACSSG